jgi:hypothetical protein
MLLISNKKNDDEKGKKTEKAGYKRGKIWNEGLRNSEGEQNAALSSYQSSGYNSPMYSPSASLCSLHFPPKWICVCDSDPK